MKDPLPWILMAALFFGGLAGMAIGSRGKPAIVRKERLGKTMSYAAIVLVLFTLAFRGGVPIVGVGWLIAVGGALELCRTVWRTDENHRAPPAFLAASAALYFAMAAGFITFLTISRPMEIVYVFLGVFCFDAFSQVTGQILGRRPLAPRISPNKTIEGFVGGAAAAIFAGWITIRWSAIPLWHFRSTIIVIAGLSGDLAASHFKRIHGVKDFSNWLPYQGGFLDRFDSLIAACAAIWLFNSLLAYVGVGR